MILGADKQNKNLREAAAKTKDTSPRIKSSNNYAAKIASGKGDKRSANAADAKDTAHESKKNLKTSDTVKWSKEGLMNEKSTLIQMNNSGYANKKNQLARYSKSFETHKSPFMQRDFTNTQQSGIVDNYSGFTQESSSSSRIKAMQKLNTI